MMRLLHLARTEMISACPQLTDPHQSPTSLNTTWSGLRYPSIPSHWTEWRPGSTPLSTLEQVATAICLYLAVTLGGQHLMRGHQPIKLPFFFKVHNLALTVGSAILLSLIVGEVLPMWRRHGTFYVLCHECAFTPQLESYYIVNYYFKYYELLDTLFLVLRKKPLTFLHVFHHAATAVLCYSQLEGRVSIEWTIISLNLLVHVLMYYYYYSVANNVKIWWKKYLTTVQIGQFVIDLGLVHWGLYTQYAHRFSAYGLKSQGSCAGSQTAAWLGWALLSSYLVLFVRFYLKTYKMTDHDSPSRSSEKQSLLVNASYAAGTTATKVSNMVMVES